MKTIIAANCQRLLGLIMLLFCFSLPAQAAGTFRFLTTALPDGTTDREYFAKIFTANAAGPVEFSIKTGCGAQCEPLPFGITLNPQTGTVSGKPTVVDGSGAKVTFVAYDGVSTIELFKTIKVNAQGGGGNSGASFVTTSLPDGRVGEPYTLTLQSQGGTGPFIWGAQDLPVGITLNGATGVLSGAPVVSGTFYVTFTNNDTGEGKNATTTLPMTIYPADADADPNAIPPVLPDYMFKFATFMLNNGEVGTAFSDTYTTTGALGSVSYSATGLPAGLTIDPATGVVSGTPGVAGTFYLTILATDNGTNPSTTISANLPMWVAPAPGSNFYWNYFGVPAGLYGMSYQGSVPILVSALNGGTVSYSALGLPPGISYNATTGELTGTPSEVGVFPVIYTATSSSLGQVLTLATDFIVLPPGGGDVGRLAVNLWIKKLSAKVNTDTATTPNDSWTAQYIYNADRRTDKIFNPYTQAMLLGLGGSEIQIPKNSATMSEKSGVFSYKSAKGVVPALTVKGTPSAQTLAVTFKSTELGTTLPAEMLPNSIILGSKGYKLKTALDLKGRFLPTSSYRNASFVVSSASVKDLGSSKDSALLSMYLADPSLLADYDFDTPCPEGSPNCKQPTVIIKLYDGVNVLLEKDLTSLVATTRIVDKAGKISYKMKKVVKADPDLTGQNLLSSFSFDSKKGLLKVALKNLVLASSLPIQQAHVGVELKIGSMSYFTSITLFESKLGSNVYNSKVSAYGKPYPSPPPLP